MTSCCIYLCVLSVDFFAAENKSLHSFGKGAEKLALRLQKLFRFQTSRRRWKVRSQLSVRGRDFFLLRPRVIPVVDPRVCLLPWGPGRFCKGAASLLLRGWFVFSSFRFVRLNRSPAPCLSAL